MGLRTRSLLVTLIALGMTACQSLAAPQATVTQGSSLDLNQAQAIAYNGPMARIAVARFTDKTGKGWWSGRIGDGMADQLATALVMSNRFVVLERQNLDAVLAEQDLGGAGRIRGGTEAAIGEIEGAELLVVGAVTEFEGAASGGRGSMGGFGGGLLGAVAGDLRRSHMAIDLRVIDARTSRILLATTVEGSAMDFDAGAAFGAATGFGGLGGALSGWKNTPTEKALRACLNQAVSFLMTRTPPVYFRHQG